MSLLLPSGAGGGGGGGGTGGAGRFMLNALVHTSLQTMCPDIYPLQPPGKYIPDICPLD